MRLHAWRAIGALGTAIIAGPTFAAILAGKVVEFSNGDTVAALTEEHIQVKVRVAGIDAPEKGQSFRQAARSSVSDCSLGKHAPSRIGPMSPT